MSFSTSCKSSPVENLGNLYRSYLSKPTLSQNTVFSKCVSGDWASVGMKTKDSKHILKKTALLRNDPKSHTNLSTIFHCRNRSKYMLFWYSSNGAPLRYSWSALQDPINDTSTLIDTHVQRRIDDGTDFWQLLKISSEALNSRSLLHSSSSLCTISRTLEDWTHARAWKHCPSYNRLMFWQGSLNIRNKRFPSNVNRMFFQWNLVLNNVLKMLAQEHHLHFIHGGFFFSWASI